MRSPYGLLWLGLTGLMLGSCGQEVDLTIVLARADDATLAGLSALRINVRELSEPAPEIFGPFTIESMEETSLRSAVTPGEPFYVDIWGCVSAEQCVADEVIGRGCTDILVVEPASDGDEGVTVGVIMDDMPVERCPP